MKLLKWVNDNFLLILTVFLLAFIPLYPKFPIINVKNTWVYVRLEDFLMVFVFLVWFIQLIRGKVSLKTPLTIPIMIFWIVGGIATIHGVLLIFPTIATGHSNVAFLSYLRRIEYLSVFFIAFEAIQDKKIVPYVFGVVLVTLLSVVVYGLGQRYASFPAYLTMNEEYAKGVAIHLSSNARIPSTFGGHYDLAAYLVLILPLIASMIFGFKNWFVKLFLVGSVGAGLVLLALTVSRVSFLVFFVSIIVVLFLQKRKFVLLAAPIALIVLGFLFLGFSHGLLARFGNTVKKIDILVDSTSGFEIGQVKTVPASDFDNTTIIKRSYQSVNDFVVADRELASVSANMIYPNKLLPQLVMVVVPANVSTGENLPQGTGYINLSMSPVIKHVGDFFYKRNVVDSRYSLLLTGDFLIKRASAYDLSFTTRYQGEWPNAIAAFERNIFLGSGYSSISLAVDNNYLRILGEVGLFGFIAFISIFIFIGIYIYKIWPSIDSNIARSFVIGVIGGIIGLFLNATLIDVFEASKVAFSLWLLVGVTLGIAHLYKTKSIFLYKNFKNVMISKYAFVIYLTLLGIVLYSPLINNFFTGDDFTWLRWVADCTKFGNLGHCPTLFEKAIYYFTQSDGFFFRPGAKIYFMLMYQAFWLNQVMYHIVSITLHILVSILFFLLAKKMFKNVFLAFLCAALFIMLNGYSEAFFWISSTGFLFTTCFALLSVLLFSMWEAHKKMLYYVLSFVFLVLGLLFHELGIVTPFLIVAYSFVFSKSLSFRKVIKDPRLLFVFIPILIYLLLRFFAGSHWFNGDYNYDLIKLPFNIVGNSIGYFVITMFGSMSTPAYTLLRNYSKTHLLLSSVALLGTGVIVSILYFLYKKKFLEFIKKIEVGDKKIIIFGSLFFVVSLIPFLGLGNITSRYSYMASLGVMILFVFVIQKIYIYLLKNGQDIAIVSVGVILSLFILLQVIELQQTHLDWQEAGKRVNNFFVTVQGAYRDYWSTDPMEFHFVNVPIRNGNSWVFPVGLNDALWFVFQNPKLRVYQDPSTVIAVSEVQFTPDQKIFVFGEDGTVTEFKKPVTRIQGVSVEKQPIEKLDAR